ncbi:MAG TPA: hypothetical protein VHZ24_10900 [Pirellulales bacterium]|jgi:hypothetical protein|nr:hypothetical protein [Pirellulales bacterium]
MAAFEAKSTVLLVTGTALFGLALGALFGLAAGFLAPTFFQRFIPWEMIEPLGFAIVLGATGGVLCGGALGVFAVAVQLVVHLVTRPRNQAQ